MDLSSGLLALVGITLLAAFVNGALGYGFSSLTVPVGLLFLSNRVLNPALVLIEVFINIYVLIINWAAVPRVWKRVAPILVGLLPGVAAGSWLLASIHPGWLKFATYALLLPLILFVRLLIVTASSQSVPPTQPPPLRVAAVRLPNES